MVYKNLLLFLLLMPSIVGATGLTLPQGGLGTTTAPAGWFLVGSTTLLITATTTASTSNLIISGLGTGTQCLHANAIGQVTGTGSDCGAGGGTNTDKFATSSTQALTIFPNSALSLVIGRTATTTNSMLEVSATTTSGLFNATSTNATSTFSGGLKAGGNQGLYVLQNGHMGINTSTPTTNLMVIGNTTASSTGGLPALTVTSSGDGACLEMRSAAGVQTAYISCLGSTSFNNMAAASGAISGTLTVGSGLQAIVATGSVSPSSGNSYDLGDGTNYWQNVYGKNWQGISGGIVNSNAFSTNGYYELATQGSSCIKWQSNSHSVNWCMGNQSGSDQTWTWPGDYGSGGFLQVNGSGTVSLAAAPVLSAVLSAGNDAGSQSILNPSLIKGATGSNFFIRAGDTGGNVVIDGNTAGGSGAIVFGQNTSDTIYLVAGDAGGSPSNGVTPAKWITVKDNSNGTYYIPLYQ